MWPIRWLRIQSMMDNGQILMQTNGLDKHVVSVQSTIFFLTQSAVQQYLLQETLAIMILIRQQCRSQQLLIVNQHTYSTAYRLPYTRSQIRHSWADTTTFPMKLSRKLCSVLFCFYSTSPVWPAVWLLFATIAGFRHTPTLFSVEVLIVCALLLYMSYKVVVVRYAFQHISYNHSPPSRRFFLL